MATIYRTNGTTQEVQPANGTDFKIAEVRAIVGGSVEVINLKDGRIMLANDESKIMSMPRNDNATTLAGFMTPTQLEAYKKEQEKQGVFVIDATGGEQDYIAGDVLVCEDDEFR